MARASATTLESECHPEELDLLRRILSDHDLTATHLEIGTAAGGTLKEIMGVYAEAESRPAFAVIDPMTYFKDQQEKVRQNLNDAGIDPDTVAFWVGTTEDFLARERSAGTAFDFIFVDGEHQAHAVMVDMQWADLLRTGGFICFHDNSTSFPGVGWAIDRFLRKNTNFEAVEQAKTLAVLRKTADGSGPCVTAADLVTARVVKGLQRFRKSMRKRFGSGTTKSAST